jgi:hypothetical protein
MRRRSSAQPCATARRRSRSPPVRRRPRSGTSASARPVPRPNAAVRPCARIQRRAKYLPQTYLGSIVDGVEIDDSEIRIIGRKDVLERAVLANGAPVPGFAVLHLNGAPDRMKLRTLISLRSRYDSERPGVGSLSAAGGGGTVGGPRVPIATRLYQCTCLEVFGVSAARGLEAQSAVNGSGGHQPTPRRSLKSSASGPRISSPASLGRARLARRIASLSRDAPS